MESVTLVIDALKWAFRAFADNLELYLKLCVVTIALLLIPVLVRFALIITVVSQLNPSAASLPVMGFIGALWSLVLFYFGLCYINVALRIYEGQKVISVEQFFVSGFLFVKSLIALILYIIFVLLGFICFIIPGLIILSRFFYVIYCVISGDAGIIESFKYSFRLTKTLPLHSFLLLICGGVLSAGWFLFPVAALMNVYAYKQRQNSITYDA